MLSDLFSSENKSGTMKFLLLLGLAGLLLILLGDFVATFSGSSPTPEPEPVEDSDSSDSSQLLVEDLETNLNNSLSQVSGVGDVQVQIRLASSGEEIYARDTTSDQEETREGEGDELTKETTRHNQESRVVTLNKGSGEEAVVKEKLEPDIEGVLVVAQGAENVEIKADLMTAVRRGLGVSSHKIAILAKER